MFVQNTDHVRDAIQYLIDANKPIAAIILAYKTNELVWLLTQHICLIGIATSPVELLYCGADGKLEIEYRIGFGCLHDCIMEKQLIHEYKMACEKLYKESLVTKTTPIYLEQDRNYFSGVGRKRNIIKNSSTNTISFDYEYDHELNFENFINRFRDIDKLYRLSFKAPYREHLPSHQMFNPKKGYPAKRYLTSQLQMRNVKFEMSGGYHDRAIILGQDQYFAAQTPINREQFLQNFEINPRYVNGHRVFELYIVTPDLELTHDNIHTHVELVTINSRSNNQVSMSKFGNSVQFRNEFFKSNLGQIHVKAIADQLIKVLDLKIFD